MNKAAMLIQERRVFVAHSPESRCAAGGYVATGGHDGILGAVGHDLPPLLHNLPTARYTWRSELNLTRLPSEVRGVRQEGSRIETVPVTIKGPDERLLHTALPCVGGVVMGEIGKLSRTRKRPRCRDRAGSSHRRPGTVS
jgi:hypothetical protein